jgi:prophage DNA circulation protein
MRTPVTQEELSYRENFTNRVQAISNVNGLFTDVEDKARRLAILKSLVGSLHLGDDILDLVQKEVDAAEEAARKAKEAEEAEAAAQAELEKADDTSSDDTELDLAAMPDDELEEDLTEVVPSTSEEETSEAPEETTLLLEDHTVFENDDLPTPEEIDSDRDFTENY